MRTKTMIEFYLIYCIIFLWVLKNMPRINMDATINLVINLTDLFMRINKKINEWQDSLEGETRQIERDIDQQKAKLKALKDLKKDKNDKV